MFRFASAWWLALLVLVPPVIWWFARRLGRGDARLHLPGAAQLPFAGGTLWTRVERLVPWLRGLALALMIVALARPQTGDRRETVSSLGVDIVVALDMSGSMACQDEPSVARLAVAKRSIAEFVAGRPSDRIGLVAFASVATTRCPITLDQEMLRSYVDQIDYAPPGEDGTAIGMGLATAVNRLQTSKAKSRVVVLVTDGRNNAGQIGPEAAAEAARALGAKVYTIGVGSEGDVRCPVNTAMGVRYVTSRQDLDEALLGAIARSTGGRYFRATDAAGMREAFAAIDALEKTEAETKIRVVYSEQFARALFPAGLLLLVELVLTLGRLRRIP